MFSKRFYFNIVIRIILILITFILVIPLSNIEERSFSILGLSFLIFIQVSFLLRYINRFNNEIAGFFSALKLNDTSFTFHNKIFQHISIKVEEDINHIRNQLFKVNESKEIQQSYFKSVIENAQTGILVFNKDGKVDVINKSALDLIGLSFLNNISELRPKYKELHANILQILPGEEILIQVKNKDKATPLALRASEFIQKFDKYKLISFQNIQSELDQKEIESWHKLIRILTHEINNTVSPITSLASSLQNLYKRQNKKVTKETINDQIIQKTSEGLGLIANRGEGLIEFVRNYKEIASLKQLNFERIKIAELFYNLEALMKNKLEENKINLHINIKPFDLELNADKKYLEQIIINLIKNSIEAIEGINGIITLTAFQEKNKNVILEISDNGKGIPSDILDQIFVPFFTTKKQGSGIGLSLARQIMQLHGGSISVQSESNIQTIFTLTF